MCGRETPRGRWLRELAVLFLIWAGLAAVAVVATKGGILR